MGAFPKHALSSYRMWSSVTMQHHVGGSEGSKQGLLIVTVELACDGWNVGLRYTLCCIVDAELHASSFNSSSCTINHNCVKLASSLKAVPAL